MSAISKVASASTASSLRGHQNGKPNSGATAHVGPKTILGTQHSSSKPLPNAKNMKSAGQTPGPAAKPPAPASGGQNPAPAAKTASSAPAPVVKTPTAALTTAAPAPVVKTPTAALTTAAPAPVVKTPTAAQTTVVPAPAPPQTPAAKPAVPTNPTSAAPKIPDVKAVTTATKSPVVDEIKELTQEIKLRQAMVKVQEAKWFGKKDVSEEKTLISKLATKLVHLLFKIFQGHKDLNNVRCFNATEEQEFAHDAERLIEACSWAGSEFDSTSADAKKEFDEAKSRAKSATAREKHQAYLQDQIAKLQTLVEQKDKHETIRWLTGQWTTEGAHKKIKEMRLELARMDEHLQITNLDKVMKDAPKLHERNSDLLKLQKGVLEALVLKKQALIPLQVADSLENLATRREIRECNDQLQAIAKRLEALSKEEDRLKMLEGLSRVKRAEMSVRSNMQGLSQPEQQQLIHALFGE